MSRRKEQVKLSKGVLEMRFMKRTRERYEREAEAATAATLLAAVGAQIESGKGRAPKEPSFSKLLDLTDGRFSFRGMNPAIELLMNPKIDEKVPEVDITDKEMAAAKNPLVHSMAAKFVNKREKDDARKSEKQQNRRERQARIPDSESVAKPHFNGVKKQKKRKTRKYGKSNE